MTASVSRDIVASGQRAAERSDASAGGESRKATFKVWRGDANGGRLETYTTDVSEGMVVLDAIHEIDYLTWLFGPIDSVACQAARLSTLDIDTEDYAAISLRPDR